MIAISASRRRLLAGPLALVALAVVLGSVFFMSGSPAHGQSDLVSTNPVDIAAGAAQSATAGRSHRTWRRAATISLPS